jgi:hypothetical protein
VNAPHSLRVGITTMATKARQPASKRKRIGDVPGSKDETKETKETKEEEEVRSLGVIMNDVFLMVPNPAADDGDDMRLMAKVERTKCSVITGDAGVFKGAN